jgi:hypothetical protein
LASDAGVIDGEVHRIASEFSASIAGSSYEEAATADNNIVAAMPSLHVGCATLVALVLASYGRKPALAGAGYVAAMGLALVYLGEHYLVDEIAGILLALVAWRLVAGSDSRRRQPREGMAIGEVPSSAGS